MFMSICRINIIIYKEIYYRLINFIFLYAKLLLPEKLSITL